MHRAPAVSVSTASSRWHLRCIFALLFVGIVALTSFLTFQPQPPWQTVQIVTFVVLVAVIAFVAWAKAPKASLCWDGHHWYWSGFSGRGACQLSLRLDWQDGLLVLLRSNSGQRVWVWLEASADDLAWCSLRRAIVSSQGNSQVEDHSAPLSRLEGAM